MSSYHFYWHCSPAFARFATYGCLLPPWTLQLPQHCPTKALIANNWLVQKSKSPGPLPWGWTNWAVIDVPEPLAESSCGWGFTWNHTHAWPPLSLPFLLPIIAYGLSREPFLDKSFTQECLAQALLLGKPDLSALDRLLTLQLCASLVNILLLNLLLYSRKISWQPKVYILPNFSTSTQGLRSSSSLGFLYKMA